MTDDGANDRGGRRRMSREQKLANRRKRDKALRDNKKIELERLRAGAKGDAGAKGPKPTPQPRRPIDLERLAEIMKMASRRRRPWTPENSPFLVTPEQLHPPNALPPRNLRAPPKGHGMAMDQQVTGWASSGWAAAGSLFGLAAAEGQAFLGYPYLSELAQRPEYRTLAETIADDATRKWIDFDITGTKEEVKERQREDQEDPEGRLERRQDRVRSADKMKRVKELKDEFDRLRVRDEIYQNCRNDNFFGRSHLFLDFGADLDGAGDDELAAPIGDGRDEVSKAKIAKGSFKGLRTIEPVWTYPMTYNAVNPLREDWYNPQVWYVLGKQIHVSRLLLFIGHPVPDLLKPTYSFGGLSLSQMAQPYVDIWLQTRQSVAQLIHSFSVMVLSTDMQQVMSPYNDLVGRVAEFNLYRDNMGAFVINKETEEFQNVAAPLSGLHELQAQAQEHICVRGGTLISTDRGQVPIEQVTVEDCVLTRRGFFPVKWAGQTGTASKLIRIETADSAIEVTECHPVWSDSTSEFVNARNVTPSHRLLALAAAESERTANRSHGAVAGGRKRKMVHTEGLSDICTERFGRRIAAPFLMAMKSITAMAIRPIINWTISNCLAQPSIAVATPESASMPSSAALWPNAEYAVRSLTLYGLDVRSVRKPARVKPTACAILSKYLIQFRSKLASLTSAFALAMNAQLTRHQLTQAVNHHPSLGADVGGAGKRGTDTFGIPGRAAICTEKFGECIGEIFQMVMSFITSMVMKKIISSTIWNYLIADNTPVSIASASVESAHEYTKSNANNAARNSWLTDRSQNFAPLSAETAQVMRVRTINTQPQPVFNICVDGLPEFFANNILVHNCSVSRIPSMKFTGISPTGMNASSEGELRSYYDNIAAYQNRFIRPNLTRVMHFAMLSLWGEVDEEITFEFEPLWEMSEKERAELQKAEAERDQTFVDGGAISPEEWRARIIDDPGLPYADLDPEDVPSLREEEMQGLVPEGAGRGLESILGEPGAGEPTAGGGGPGGGPIPPAPGGMLPAPQKGPDGGGAPEMPSRDPAFTEDEAQHGLPWAANYEWMRGFDLPTQRKDGAPVVRQASGDAADRGLRVGSRVRYGADESGGTGRVFGFVRDPGGGHDQVAVLDHDNDRALFALLDQVASRPVAMDAWEESKHPRGQPGNKGQFGSGGGAGEAPKPETGEGGSRAVMRSPSPAAAAPEGGKADRGKIFGKAMAAQLEKANAALEAAPKEARERHAERIAGVRKFFSSEAARDSVSRSVAAWAAKHAAGVAQHHVRTGMMMPVVHHVVEAAVEQIGLASVPGVTLGATAVAAYAAHHIMDEYGLTIGGAKELLVGAVRGAIDVLGGVKEVAARVAALEEMAGDKDDDVLDALILLLLALEELDAEGGQAGDAALFEESKHPRDDSGKFSDKGASSSGGEQKPEDRDIESRAAELYQKVTEHVIAGRPEAAQAILDAIAALEKLDPEAVKRGYDRQVAAENREAKEKLDLAGKGLRETVAATARRLKFNPSRIEISAETKNFTLNGRQYKYAGAADLETGKITLYESELKPETVAGITAHEIMHEKFQAFIMAYENERRRLDDELRTLAELPDREFPMKADGTLREGWAERFPLYQNYTKLHMDWDKFRKSDGVSDYSKEWWKAAEPLKPGEFPRAQATTAQAFHETLAEMARVQLETGKLPGAKVWKDLYRAINADWRASMDAFKRAGP